MEFREFLEVAHPVLMQGSRSRPFANCIVTDSGVADAIQLQFPSLRRYALIKWGRDAWLVDAPFKGTVLGAVFGLRTLGRGVKIPVPDVELEF